jgi:hypothetical protein
MVTIEIVDRNVQHLIEIVLSIFGTENFEVSGDVGNLATVLYCSILNISLSSAVAVICFVIHYELTPLLSDGVGCTHLT